MKKIPFLVFLLVVAGCHAKAPPPANQFDATFAVLSSDKIFSSSFESVMRQLKGICKPSSHTTPERDSNVECAAEAMITDLSISPTKDPFIKNVSGVVPSKDKCPSMNAYLTKLYGKPKVGKGSCALRWTLKPGPSGAARTIELEGKENMVYFSIDEEQGP